MVSVGRRELLVSGIALPLAGSPAARAQATPYSSFERLLRPTVHTAGQTWSLAERMNHHRVPGAVIAVLRAGRIASMTGHGTRIAGQALPMGPDTLFSAGSVSKIATAALCMKLVSSGLLDLDEDVGRWLKRWQVPDGPDGDKSKISLRMLLSHTAGFNVHGFADYAPAAALPTLIQTLNGISPALSKALARIDKAGTRSRYSGGGYMIVQAVIEDSIGLSFDAVARRHLFAPLGMTRSRFDAGPAVDMIDIAHAHDGEGKPVALPRGWQSFPELAPSGLWISANDLIRLIVALGTSYRGNGGFLPQELAIDMMTPVSPGSFGLGPRLAGEGDARIFHHAGANDSYKSYIEGNLATGDGLVVLTNGANGDVLGDEIRSAVSDAFSWPGDWSVTTGALTTNGLAAAGLLDGFAGTYSRQPAQSPEMMGILDTIYDIDRLVILRSGDALHMQVRERRRPLTPVASNRFVAPEAYIPAGTLQLRFNRGADRSVRSLSVIGGGGVVAFDRVPP